MTTPPKLLGTYATPKFRIGDVVACDVPTFHTNLEGVAPPPRVPDSPGHR
jgi:hypothetical protein